MWRPKQQQEERLPWGQIMPLQTLWAESLHPHPLFCFALVENRKLWCLFNVNSVERKRVHRHLHLSSSIKLRNLTLWCQWTLRVWDQPLLVPPTLSIIPRVLYSSSTYWSNKAVCSRWMMSCFVRGKTKKSQWTINTWDHFVNGERIVTNLRSAYRTLTLHDSLTNQNQRELPSVTQHSIGPMTIFGRGYSSDSTVVRGLPAVSQNLHSTEVSLDQNRVR